MKPSHKTLPTKIIYGAGGVVGRMLDKSGYVISSDIVKGDAVRDENGEYLQCDVTNVDSLEKTLDRFIAVSNERKSDINAIYYLPAPLSAAAERDPSLAKRIIVDAYANLAEMVQKKGSKAFIVAVSSMAVCDENIKELFQKQTLSPKGVYGTYKLEVEEIAGHYNQQNMNADLHPQHCALRLPGVFSGNDDRLGDGTTECLPRAFNHVFDSGKAALPLKDDTILPMAFKDDVSRGFNELVTLMNTIKEEGAHSYQEEDLEELVRFNLPAVAVDIGEFKKAMSRYFKTSDIFYELDEKDPGKDQRAKEWPDVIPGELFTKLSGFELEYADVNALIMGAIVQRFRHKIKESNIADSDVKSFVEASNVKEEYHQQVLDIL